MLNERQQQIIDNTSPTITIKNFLSEVEQIHLLNIHKDRPDHEKVFKNTGPVVSKLPHESDHHYQNIMKRVESVLDAKIKPFGGNYFTVKKPHILHNDVPKDHAIIPGKCIVLPLEKVYTTYRLPMLDDAKFYIFDQMYFDRPVKCFKNKDSAQMYEKGNEPIFEYSGVHNLHQDNRIPNTDTGHMKQEWLEGFSIESECPWVPGDAIIFDCARLHCSSNFLENGMEEKTGLSIFTEYVT